jgi:hypothetical protein
VTSLDRSDHESRLSLELVRDTLALRTIQPATHWGIDLSLILGIVVGIVLLWALILVLLLLFRPEGVPLRDLIRVVPDVMRLLRSIIGDRSTPLDVRAVLVLLLVWIISPIDLIPEFIPVLGPLDERSSSAPRT